MAPTHHPSAVRLASFATGETPLAPGLAIAAHLEACPRCAATVQSYELREAQLLESMAPVAMADDAFVRVMQRIQDEAGPAQSATDDVEELALPRAIQVAGLLPRHWVMPGFWVAQVNAPEQDEWRTFVARAPAGASIPEHEHRGGEFIAVLSGALIGIGATTNRLAAGDFEEEAGGSGHSLRVDSDGPCVCVIAIQGRARWRGWAKILGPLTNI